MDCILNDWDSDENSEKEVDVEANDFEDNILKRAIGTFILKLRASSNLRQPNIDSILMNLRDVVSTYVRASLYHVEEILENNRIELRELVDIDG